MLKEQLNVYKRFLLHERVIVLTSNARLSSLKQLSFPEAIATAVHVSGFLEDRFTGTLYSEESKEEHRVIFKSRANHSPRESCKGALITTQSVLLTY